MTSRRDVTSFVLWYRDVVAALLKWQEINIPPTWNTGPTSHYVGMMLTLHNVNTPTFLSMVNTAVIAIPVLHCCTDQIKVIMRWDSVSQWWQFVYTSPDEFNWPIIRHRKTHWREYGHGKEFEQKSQVQEFNIELAPPGDYSRAVIRLNTITQTWGQQKI